MNGHPTDGKAIKTKPDTGHGIQKERKQMLDQLDMVGKQLDHMEPSMSATS